MSRKDPAEKSKLPFFNLEPIGQKTLNSRKDDVEKYLLEESFPIII